MQNLSCVRQIFLEGLAKTVDQYPSHSFGKKVVNRMTRMVQAVFRSRGGFLDEQQIYFFI